MMRKPNTLQKKLAKEKAVWKKQFEKIQFHSKIENRNSG